MHVLKSSPWLGEKSEVELTLVHRLQTNLRLIPNINNLTFNIRILEHSIVLTNSIMGKSKTRHQLIHIPPKHLEPTHQVQPQNKFNNTPKLEHLNIKNDLNLLLGRKSTF